MIAAPTKLSDAIDMALKDQIKAENSPDIQIDMGEWHAPSLGGCRMCFAGAVMHFEHGEDLEKDIETEDHGEDWKVVYRALNYVRSGHIRTALCSMGLKEEGYEDGTSLPSYDKDRNKFRTSLKELTVDLRAKGL